MSIYCSGGRGEVVVIVRNDDRKRRRWGGMEGRRAGWRAEGRSKRSEGPKTSPEGFGAISARGLGTKGGVRVRRTQRSGNTTTKAIMMTSSNIIDHIGKGSGVGGTIGLSGGKMTLFSQGFELSRSIIGSIRKPLCIACCYITPKNRYISSII